MTPSINLETLCGENHFRLGVILGLVAIPLSSVRYEIS